MNHSIQTQGFVRACVSAIATAAEELGVEPQALAAGLDGCALATLIVELRLAVIQGRVYEPDRERIEELLERIGYLPR